MTINATERKKMLAVRLCGPRVVTRLEAAGIETLTDLADWSPDELALAVNLAPSRPVWSGPIPFRAMENLIDAAPPGSASALRRLGADTKISIR